MALEWVVLCQYKSQGTSVKLIAFPAQTEIILPACEKQELKIYGIR